MPPSYLSQLFMSYTIYHENKNNVNDSYQWISTRKNCTSSSFKVFFSVLFFSDIVLCIYMNPLIYLMVVHPQIFNFRWKKLDNISHCMHINARTATHILPCPCILTRQGVHPLLHPILYTHCPFQWQNNMSRHHSGDARGFAFNVLHVKWKQNREKK